ncbi:unnamed protein product, partial [Candidula unifasciata]
YKRIVLYKMVSSLLLLAVTAVLATAEQVPCTTGEQQCKGHQSLSIVNNNHYCCGHGFNLQWRSPANNDQSPATCICDRQFYEIDCVEGNVQCQDATSFVSDGYTTKCCPVGYSMNSVSNSFINGVKVDYCKCTRSGTIGRQMTEAEKAQFTQAMSQFSQGLQTGLNQMQQTLNTNLGSLGGFMSGITDGLRRSLNTVANQFGALALQSGNMSQAQPALPASPYDLRQRRFQQLQRRLQQRQPSGRGSAMWDRLNGNPALSQMMTPNWWFGQDWRGLYANQTAQNSNTTRTNEANPSVASPLPAQNATVKV